MNCDEAGQKLVLFSEELLQNEERIEIEAHLLQCAPCRHKARLERLSQQRYLRALQDLSVPEPPPGKLAHMLRLASLDGAQQGVEFIASQPVIKANELSRRYSFVVVAIVCVVLLMSNVIERGDGVYPAQRDVSVVIDVPNAMQRVALALKFPDSLRWRGLEDRQRVAWTVDLESGRNVLTLPLVVQANSELQEAITATVAYKDVRREFVLPVAFTGAPTTQTQPLKL